MAWPLPGSGSGETTVATAFEYTVEVAAGRAGDRSTGVERHDVYTHLEGNFPGGTVDLTNSSGCRDGAHRLELADRADRRLTIA